MPTAKNAQAPASEEVTTAAAAKAAAALLLEEKKLAARKAKQAKQAKAKRIRQKQRKKVRSSGSLLAAGCVNAALPEGLVASFPEQLQRTCAGVQKSADPKGAAD